MMIRGNMKKWFMLVVLVFVFVMVAAGEVWEIRAASVAAKRVKLRMMIEREPTPEKLLPAAAAEPRAGMVLFNNIMEPLVDYSPKGLVPKLATKWEQRDATTWRFYLRKGVKFHNGDNFTARDVAGLAKWNLDEKETNKLYRYMPIKEAVVVDDYIVDLIFERPQPLLLLMIQKFLIPPLAISRDNRELIQTNMIGTGPYRFVEWKKGQYMKLTRFEGYWGPKPQIDDVEIIYRLEGSVRLAALKVGEVDWVSALTSEEGRLAPKVASVLAPDTIIFFIDEYIQKELGRESILADKRLRLAVDYAIDRQALIALMGKDFAVLPRGQIAAPRDFGFNPDLKDRPYDLAKAKALVREAGAVGKTVSLVAASDRFVKMRELSEAIAYMIEQTGLKAKLMLMPSTTEEKYRYNWGENRQWKADIVVGACDAFLEVDGRFGTLFGRSKGEGTHNMTTDTEPDRLYKESRAEADFARRGEKLGKAWAYVHQEAHYLSLLKYRVIWGLAKNLEWELDGTERPLVANMRFTD